MFLKKDTISSSILILRAFSPETTIRSNSSVFHEPMSTCSQRFTKSGANAVIFEESLGISNVTQELGLIHTREENRQTKNNFIPLFFFDKSNRKLLILEPTIYQIREYNSQLITDIISELSLIQQGEQLQIKM